MDPNKPQEGAAEIYENAVTPDGTAHTPESGVGEIQNAVKLKLYVDKLDAQTLEVERVCE